MTRAIEEVVASQKKMTDRLGTKGADLDPEQLQRGLTAHRNEIIRWLQNVPHMEFIEVDYPALIRDPGATIARMVNFLGEERLPSHEKMKAVVDPSLYRRKS
jgi:LPS sulfotransferase NodH